MIVIFISSKDGSIVMMCESEFPRRIDNEDRQGKTLDKRIYASQPRSACFSFVYSIQDLCLLNGPSSNSTGKLKETGKPKESTTRKLEGQDLRPADRPGFPGRKASSHLILILGPASSRLG